MNDVEAATGHIGLAAVRAVGGADEDAVGDQEMAAVRREGGVHRQIAKFGLASRRPDGPVVYQQCLAAAFGPGFACTPCAREGRSSASHDGERNGSYRNQASSPWDRGTRRRLERSFGTTTRPSMRFPSFFKAGRAAGHNRARREWLPNRHLTVVVLAVRV